MYAWGRKPLYGLVGSGIVQAFHCYEPFGLFYSQGGNPPFPSWPYQNYDIDWLRDYVKPIADFAEETGTTVIVNEFGVPVTTDYENTLAYMDDLLTVFDEHGWAWSMYDYAGGFNLVKSTNPDHVREGAVYEEIAGREVDIGLLAVLQKHMTR